MERVCRDSGALAALALLTAVVSGALLAFDYQPSRQAAYDSVLALGDPALRQLHAHATHAAIALTLLHAALALVASTRWAWPGLWLSGVGAAALTVVVAYSGRVLPWDLHGAASLTVAEQLFGVRFGSLAAQAWLHGLLSIALCGLGVWHVIDASRERESKPRRGERWLLLGGLATLLLVALVVEAPLDARFRSGALEPGFVGAEWYLRWLQWIGVVVGPNAARFVLVLLLVALALTPLVAKRVGVGRLRWGWLVTAALLLLLSVLPVSLSAAGGS